MVLLLGVTLLMAMNVTVRKKERENCSLEKYSKLRRLDLSFSFPKLESYLFFKISTAPTPGQIMATVYGTVQGNGH